jgi:hypothetical protein
MELVNGVPRKSRCAVAGNSCVSLGPSGYSMRRTAPWTWVRCAPPVPGESIVNQGGSSPRTRAVATRCAAAIAIGTLGRFVFKGCRETRRVVNAFSNAPMFVAEARWRSTVSFELQRQAPVPKPISAAVQSGKVILHLEAKPVCVLAIERQADRGLEPEFLKFSESRVASRDALARGNKRGDLK